MQTSGDPETRALGLAEAALFLTSPNPRVGCVIIGPDGQVLGQGHTQKAGGPHAEIMALRDVAAKGLSASGATAYVTLEPCAHQGRTGPCCDALIDAGIRKVVASIEDPHVKVKGQGFAKLRSAGIEVQMGALGPQSRELNLGFFSRHIRKTPWVRLKAAASLDGKTALKNGVSQWLTAEPARADGHTWRARACAVLTGMGTVLADNPLMDVRHVPTQRQPTLVLIDSRLEVPLDASIFIANRAILIYTLVTNPQKNAALAARGATVIALPGSDAVPAGKLDLKAVMRDLAAREINEVHVEAGQKLNASLVRAGLVDEFLLYLAPKWAGQGEGIAEIGPLTALSETLPLKYQSIAQIGPDLRILARGIGRDVF